MLCFRIVVFSYIKPISITSKLIEVRPRFYVNMRGRVYVNIVLRLPLFHIRLCFKTAMIINNFFKS